MEQLKYKWAALPPQKKTMAMVGGGFFLLVVMIFGFSDDAPTNHGAKPKTNNEVGVFETGSEETNIKSLDTKVTALQQQLNTKEQQIQNLSQQLQQQKDILNTVGDGEDKFSTIYEINAKLAELEEKQRQLDESLANRAQQTVVQTAHESPVKTVSSQPNNSPVPKAAEPVTMKSPIRDKVSKEPIPDDPLAFLSSVTETVEKRAEEVNEFIGKSSKSGVSTVKTSEEMRAGAIQIVTAEEENPLTDTDEVTYKGLEVLAGSQIPAIVVTGVDAPTGKAAEKGAISSTLRITGPAITPNGNRVDLTGCLVTVDVRGDSATERAYFRPQNLTCEYDIGNVDIKIKGYVTGADGSMGLRGNLRSKQGKALLYGTLSGTVQGVGQAFGGGQNSQQTVIGQSGFQLPSTSQVRQGVASSSVASGSEFLTEYYRDKLEELYEVIELKSLIPASVHIQESFILELNGNVNH